MENILTKYLQNTAHAYAFTFLEQEIARLIKVTLEQGYCIAIQKTLLNRLSKVDAELISLTNIFTFEDKLSDILNCRNPLAKHIPKDERAFLRYGVKHNERWDYCSRSEHLPIFQFKMAQVSDVTRYFTLDDEDLNNSQFIDYVRYELGLEFFSYLVIQSNYSQGAFYSAIEQFNNHNNLYLHPSQLTAQYVDIFVNKMNPVETETQASIILQESYINTIKAALYPICNNYRKNNVHCLLGVFLDIANMERNQLAQFTTDYFTNIPYFPKLTVPVTAIVDRSDTLTGLRTEFLIRGQHEAVHLVFNQHGVDTIMKFDKYKLSDGETVKFRGEPIVLDNECLTGENLSVVEWLLYSDETLKVYTDFTFDYESILRLAMSGLHENNFTLYLQDRSGLHHRWKK